MNEIEDEKILRRIEKFGKKSTENVEYYNDLVSYRSYAYQNFKDFEKYGFSLEINKDITIDALRLMVNEKSEFTNAKYRELFKVSNQTFVRDMRLMSELGFIVSEGQGRGIRYRAKT